LDKIPPFTETLPLLLSTSDLAICSALSHLFLLLSFIEKGLRRAIPVSSRGFWASSARPIRLTDAVLEVKARPDAELNSKVSLFRGDMTYPLRLFLNFLISFGRVLAILNSDEPIWKSMRL
jgi:hypothetical protein